MISVPVIRLQFILDKFCSVQILPDCPTFKMGKKRKEYYIYLFTIISGEVGFGNMFQSLGPLLGPCCFLLIFLTPPGD